MSESRPMMHRQRRQSGTGHSACRPRTSLEPDWPIGHSLPPGDRDRKFLARTLQGWMSGWDASVRLERPLRVCLRPSRISRFANSKPDCPGRAWARGPAPCLARRSRRSGARAATCEG